MNATELWSLACVSLSRVLNKDTYTRWIDIIRPAGLSNGTLTLSVDNDFTQTWLEDNFRPVILDALHSAGAPADLVLTFTVHPMDIPETPAAVPPPEPVSAPAPVRRRRPAVPTQLDPVFTFENFVTGPSNSFAHAAALGVSQSPGRAYNPLFIYGETGIGKTHLMQAIGNRVLQTSSSSSVAYVTSETLLNEYIDSIQTATPKAFRDKYRNIDVLMVDDIQFLAGKNALQQEFFHTFNELHAARKQIIMTSDLPPKELAGLEPRLVSRFEWGLVTQIEKPDFETRLAILRYKQSSSKVQLPDALLTFIADNVTSNVRALEGALNKAFTYIQLAQSPQLSLDILRSLLKDTLNSEHQKDLSFDDIQRSVADYYNLRLSDMTSKERPRSVAAPRQLAMYLSRKLTRASLPEIAKAFDKTHATVVHACKTVQDRAQVDPELQSAIRDITRSLGRDPSSLSS